MGPNEILLTILYSVLIVLVIIFIILGIKLICTLKKVDDVVENVNKKVRTLDGVFDFIDGVISKLTLVNGTIVNAITGFITNLFTKRKKKGEDEDD